MKSQEHHVNSFIKAAADVLKLQADMEIYPETESCSTDDANQEVNLIIGLTGRLNGSVSIGMSEKTAKEIASAMVKSDLDDKKMIGSLITALGTAISSEASLSLCEMGFECTSLFPTLVTGTGVNLSSPIREQHSVSLNSRVGPIELRTSLFERRGMA